MQAVHKARETNRKVDKYIVLTEFARSKFIAAGFPQEKIVRKPNFLQTDPGIGMGAGGYVLFVGRLSPEKGISTLLAASQMLRSGCQLKIVGDGPEADAVKRATARSENIQWLGRRSSADVYGLMQSAVAVVLPSEWYEGFPVVVAEAFATGAPLIASRIGGLAEIVEHGRTGILFPPGDADALAETLQWVYEHPSNMAAMRRNARAEYESKYTAEQNYRQLMDIYHTVITSHQELRSAA
jgi:glycosyltransferase involved in cell wall biosynthesis